MDTSIEQAINLIKKWEGFRATAYKCTGNRWTVGWGRTGADVRIGTVTTREKEEAWLKKRVESEASWLRTVSLPHVCLADCQIAALISLVYNIGRTAFQGSGVRRHLLQGNLPYATEVWARWNKSGGVITKGLVNRRADEIALFESCLYRGG